MKKIFISKTINLNIIKHKGATVVTATPGGTTSKMTPTSWIKFRNHKYVTDNPEEIEIIRKHIKECPQDGITELIPKTPDDILREEKAKLTEQMKRVEMAEKLAKGIVIEDVAVDKKPEGKYKCWFGKCDFSCDTAQGLRMHIKAMHNRDYKQKTLEGKFAKSKQ